MTEEAGLRWGEAFITMMSYGSRAVNDETGERGVPEGREK